MKIMTIRDLFETVEQVRNEQIVHGGALQHIADAVDRIEKRIISSGGTSLDDGEAPRRGGGDCTS
jgi:hypothetical protein